MSIIVYTRGTRGRCWLEFYAFDAAYLDRLRLGDPATEEHFVRYFSELITLKLRSRMQSPHTAQDIRQETFARVLRLLRKDGAVRQGESLGSLVNAVCNNVLFETYRAQGRTEPLEDATAAVLLEPRPDALQQVLSRESQAAVHRVLESLEERDRRVLRSVFVEERNKDAVCTEFGVDRNYLRVLVHRAKNAFATKYRAELPAVQDPGAARSRSTLKR